MSAHWARPSQLLSPGAISCPAQPGVPGPPSLTVLLHRLRIGPGDVLTFYDGDDLTARVLGQYSGPRGHFKLFTSMADVTIQFQSDPGASVLGYQQGFVIHFFGELAPALPCCLGEEIVASQRGQCHEPESSYLTRESWTLSQVSPEGSQSYSQSSPRAQ